MNWLMFSRQQSQVLGCLLLVYRRFVGHLLSACVLRASVHFGGPYAAVQPPSIERLAPVICDAPSPHRNSASEATCSTVTNSFVGWAASRTSLIT